VFSGKTSLKQDALRGRPKDSLVSNIKINNVLLNDVLPGKESTS